ncbi:unnamed protein product [Nesidiocoris tenuis]|uniref:Uncharacterized protein n=1 Tax=Nesidiocoris tenuis TaxID=355587 RepID=A0A6H5GW66_9HEMI|nr:unnamed protein product [Nesidiocoris tenuis]
MSILDRESVKLIPTSPSKNNKINHQKSADALSASALKRKVAQAIGSPVPGKKLKIAETFSISPTKAAADNSPSPNTKFVFVPVGKDKTPEEIRVQNSKGEVSPLGICETPEITRCSIDNIEDLKKRARPIKTVKFWRPEDFGLVSLDPPKKRLVADMDPVVCLERLEFDKDGNPLPEKSPPKRRVPSPQKSLPSSSSPKTPVQLGSAAKSVHGEILKKLSLDDNSIIKYVQDVFKPKNTDRSKPTSTTTGSSTAEKTTQESNLQIKNIAKIGTNAIKPIMLNLPNSQKKARPSYVLINEDKCRSCIEKAKKKSRLLDKGVQVDPENGDSEASGNTTERDNQAINKLLRQNLDVALLKLFNKSKPSSFSRLSSSDMTGEEDDLANTHVYASRESMNLIKSAAELCEFNNMKIKMLESILGKSKESWSEIEELAVKHVGSFLSASGLEFFRNVFQKVVQEGMERKKTGDWNVSSSKDAALLEEVEQFAIALLMHSSKTYQSFSQVMNLPHPQVVRSWAVRSTGNPGFSERAFRLLTDEAYKLGKHSIAFCLSVAQVSLAKDVSWDGEQLFGFSDLGYGQLNRDSVREATGALVFYGSAINHCWKLPLGYCLIDELSTLTRANLITQYLCRLEAAGVKCIALAAEASVESYQTFLALGMETDVDSIHFGSVQHPVFKTERVFCYFDVFQVTKLLRDYLACFKSFISRDKTIEWKYVEEIDTILEQEQVQSIKCSPDVLRRLRFLKSRMVRDPVSIHKYIASAIRLIKTAGSGDTAKFFEKLHYLTELSISNNQHAEGELQPVNRDTWTTVSNHLSGHANFFKVAKHDSSGPCILYTDQKLPMFMVYSNVRSLKAMMRKTMNSKMRINFLAAEKLQPIYVNKWLTDIKGGSTGLMTPSQFKAVFKKYMDSYDLRPSSSIKAPPKKQTEEEPKTTGLGFSYWYSYAISPLRSATDDLPKFLTKNVIENWLKTPYCLACEKFLVKEFRFYVSGKGESVNVIDDVHRMLKTAELILLEHDQIAVDDYERFFNRWANQTLNSMSRFDGFKKHGHLFNSVAFGEVSHFTLLVKQLLRAYLKLRLCFLTRQEGITFNLGKSTRV